MIQNDAELQATHERIELFERTLAEARKNYPASNYSSMAEGYLIEIDKMQSEIREYLSPFPEQNTYGGSRELNLPVKARQIIAKIKEARNLSTMDEALVYIIFQYAILQDECGWALDLNVEGESEDLNVKGESEKERKAS